jgi:DNA-binding CsgD family transcriptional regulator
VEEFKEAVFPALRKAIRGDHVSWVGYQFMPLPRMVQMEESERLITAASVAVWERNITAHPFSQYWLRTGDRSALILSDFLTQRQYREEPMFDEMRGYGVRYTLSIAMSATRNGAAALSFAGMSQDFTERDRTMLNLLRPHILQARRHAERGSALLASGAMQQAEEHHDRLAELTLREKEVADWIALGKTNAEMGLILGASPRTIEKHVQRVLEKLLVENRTAAAILINNVRGV